MRTKSAQVAAVLSNRSHSARAIVTVYNASNVPTELSSVGLSAFKLGDPVVGVEINQSIDDFRTARVRLQRQQGKYSFAPLVTSPLGTLIQVGWRIVIECELILSDITNTPAGLREVIFDGFIDETQWPGDELELVCTDQSAKLRDRWIERERVYGFANGVNATKGCYVWRYDLHTLQVGDLVIPSDAKKNGHFYAVIAAASPQSAAEPAWPTGSLATVVSGGVTMQEAGPTSEVGIDLETIIQQVLNDNGLSSIIFECPISPAWLVKPYVQQRESVMEALQAMVDQLGWWLRFEWESGFGAYVLTLKEPDRTSGTVHKTLNEADEVECTELGVDVWSIRNKVQVVYGSSASRSPSGTPQRLTVVASDAASIAKYGTRFMEVGEDDASSIDTAAEAQRLAESIRDDLKEPTLGLSVAFSVDPYLELGDRITIPADGLRFSLDQTLAVESLKHSFEGTSARTVVRLAGAPAARREGWLIMDGRANPSDVHQLSLSNSITQTLITTSSVGGQRFSITGDRAKGALNNANELHISTSPNFTPSAATLAASGEANAFDVPDLVPGKPYYAKTIPFSKNADRIVRGEPSTEISFIAGRARTGHYDSLSGWSHLPLNGNFEHASDNLASNPPDQWTVAQGTWGSGGDLFHGTDATYGRFVSLRQTAGDPLLRSSAFPVRRQGGRFNVYLSVRPQGTLTATRRLLVYLRFYRKSDLSDSPILFTYQVPHTIAAAGAWASTVIDSVTIGAIPSDVNFATITFGKEDLSSAYGWDVGDVFFCEAQQQDLWASRFIGAADTNFASPTYASGWAGTFGIANADFQYRIKMNRLQIRGWATRASGTNTLVTTLPAGFRPSTRRYFMWTYLSAGTTYASCRVDIDIDGRVLVLGTASGSAELSFDGIELDLDV